MSGITCHLLKVLLKENNSSRHYFFAHNLSISCIKEKKLKHKNIKNRDFVYILFDTFVLRVFLQKTLKLLLKTKNTVPNINKNVYTDYT